LRAAGRSLDTVHIPPGVDTQRFAPLDDEARRIARARFGVAAHTPLVVGVSRLVPRKGFDVAIRAVREAANDIEGLTMLIGGTGRDHDRLQKLIDDTRAPVKLLGRVSDDDLPSLYGCADVFMMLCRNRWAGLEQEGFGIVFAEAGACAVPQIAGDSGGAAEVVADGTTGFVVADPRDVRVVADRLKALFGDPALRNRMGMAARNTVLAEFDYDVLALRLARALEAISE
jgi:phosphatidylinositol alpha-1,6-mannosyltransferase